MQQEIQQAIKQNEAEFLNDLNQLLAVPSVKGTPEPNAPFGIEPRKALAVGLALAEKYGFETAVVDDTVGYAQFGNDQEYIGVVGHLDVVAAGSGWDFPPFALSEKDGRLYGRGVLDNKGPIFACLYGLKLLKDLEIPLKKTVRIIFGTDEESGSADLPYYLKKERPPVFGFTPDCKYPVVYGERGIVNVTIRTPFPQTELAMIGDIVGDQAKDHVPDQLSVTLETNEKISVKGKRSPTNAPEMGLNGLTLLAEKLQDHSALSADLRAYFRWIYQSFHEKHFGEGINLAIADEDSGKLILTPYELKHDEKAFELSVAIRYPVTFSEKEIIERINKVLPKSYQLEIIRSMPSTNFPKENENVKKLSAVYEAVTGLDGTPVTTTGATYARSMPNIVAFGPSFPGQKGIAHNKNEYMDLADLLKNLEIYTRAIYELAKK
ncbi:M20 family metallopeptidase [Enterococcus sp. LJL99]